MIVIIHPFLDKYGGAERKMLLLLQSLTQRHEDTIIITKSYDPRFSDYLESAGLLTSRIVLISSSRLWTWITKAAFFIARLKNLRVIFASNYPANIVASLAKLLSPCTPRLIWMCNEVSSAVNSRDLLKSSIFSSVERWSLKSFDTILCNSEATSKSLMNTYSIRSQGIIYSGIDTRLFDKYYYPETTSPVLERTIDYLYLGRIERHKNIEVLTRLARKQPNSKVVVVGSGEFLEEFRNISKPNKNIEFTGSVSHKDKTLMLSQAKVLLFPSKNEPLGVVVMEAIYCGCHVIAFSSGGPREIILKVGSGTLVSSDNDFINAAISSPTFPLSLSEITNNRIKIRKYFSSTVMTTHMINAILTA